MMPTDLQPYILIYNAKKDSAITEQMQWNEGSVFNSSKLRLRSTETFFSKPAFLADNVGWSNFITPWFSFGNLDSQPYILLYGAKTGFSIDWTSTSPYLRASC